MTPIEVNTCLIALWLAFMLIVLANIRRELKHLNTKIGEAVEVLKKSNKVPDAH